MSPLRKVVPDESISGMSKGGKGGGGNSHDRAKARVAHPQVAEFPVGPAVSSSTAIEVNGVERVLRVVDSSSIQTLAGIVGGLIGTFLDGRYFSLLSLMISLALNRSKALEGMKPRWVLSIHVLSVVITACGLFYMGIQINKSRTHTFTPSDYADAIKKHQPLPITKQITNVYKSYVMPAKTIGEPRIDLSEFISDGVDAQGGIHWHTNAINNGPVPALDVGGSAKSFVAVHSKKSEDELFEFLEKSVGDSVQPRSDLPPGALYTRFEPSYVQPLSQQDKIAMQSGIKVVYIGRIDSYKDTQGRRYQTELCMFMAASSVSLFYCDSHNKTRKQSGG